MNNNLRKRFTKDSNVPINIFNDKYWDYFIDLYDEFYDSKEKWKIFSTFINKLENQETFFTLSSKLIEGAIHKIKSSKNYKKFNDYNLNFFSPTVKLQNTELYQQNYDQKTFVSVDLKTANYQVIENFSNDIPKTYNKFIKELTDEDFFINSKYIRQVIFGNLNPKKQAKIQRNIMSNIREALNPEMEVISNSQDEIIIIDDNYKLNELDIEAMEFYKFHVEKFKLHKVGKFYFKEILEGENKGKKIIKKTPSYMIPQLIKHIRLLDVNENDLLFYHEKQLARFVNKIEFN